MLCEPGAPWAEVSARVGVHRGSTLFRSTERNVDIGRGGTQELRAQLAMAVRRGASNGINSINADGSLMNVGENGISYGY